MENTTTKNELRRSSRLTNAQVGEMHGKVPPQALEVEKAVLGAIMIDVNSLYRVIDLLHEEVFYNPAHQAIFKAIMALMNGNKAVDLLTVVDELRKEGTLEVAGGAFYVSSLTMNVVSGAHLEYHVHILIEKYMQRELIRTSTETLSEAFDEGCDPLVLIDKASERLMEVSEKSFKTDSASMDRIVQEAAKRIFTEAAESYGVNCGFLEIDRRTSGFQPGSLVILAARPAQGKTALALTMARNIAVDFKQPVVYFSLEMPAIELVMRLLASEAGIPASKLKKNGQLNEKEKQILVEKMDVLRQAELFIDDSSGLNIFLLRAKCRRLHQRNHIKMVFIDYLQLMNGTNDQNRNRNREQEISYISRQLKEMSKELGIPVMALSQLSRNTENRPGGVPQLADLRESGAIEQDADIVMALHRPIKYGMDVDEHGNSTEHLANVHVLKHRAGDTEPKIPLYFEGKYVRFSNMPVAPHSANSNGNKDIPVNENFDKNVSASMPVNENFDIPTTADDAERNSVDDPLET